MIKNAIIVLLLAVIAVGGTLAVQGRSAQPETSVEIAVWEDKESGNLYASTKPEGGNWKTQRRDDPLNMRFTETTRYWRSNVITITAPVIIDWEALANAWQIGRPPWRWEATCTRPKGRTETGGGFDTAAGARDAGWAWVRANCVHTVTEGEPLDPSQVIVTPDSH